MEKTITEIMEKEHRRIEKLLSEFEKDLNTNSKETKQRFLQFKWNLDKHFFVEEKVIFHIYNLSTEEEGSDIITLLKEHKDMYYIISKIEESLNNNTTPDLIELKNILRHHAKSEDEMLYPKLDKELSDKDKQLIFERTKEIIL